MENRGRHIWRRSYFYFYHDYQADFKMVPMNVWISNAIMAQLQTSETFLVWAIWPSSRNNLENEHVFEKKNETMWLWISTGLKGWYIMQSHIKKSMNLSKFSPKRSSEDYHNKSALKNLLSRNVLLCQTYWKRILINSTKNT